MQMCTTVYNELHITLIVQSSSAQLLGREQQGFLVLKCKLRNIAVKWICSKNKKELLEVNFQHVPSCHWQRILEPNVTQSHTQGPKQMPTSNVN